MSNAEFPSYVRGQLQRDTFKSIHANVCSAGDIQSNVAPNTRRESDDDVKTVT